MQQSLESFDFSTLKQTSETHTDEVQKLALLTAIEGIDGSGKGTQAKQLHERLVRAGTRAALISFPRYDATLFGKSVADFLNGRFGALDEVNPFLVSLLYAGDRFESREFLLGALEENEVVILDRYVASNIAHQGAKVTGTERQELVDWISRVEHDIYQLPRADLNILLDLPAAEAERLIALKHARSYTDRKADLQEADGAYLENVRQVYLDLARNQSQWSKVDCLANHALRSIDEIAEEIWEILAAHRS